MVRKFKIGDKVKIKKNALCVGTTLRPGIKGRVICISDNREYIFPYFPYRVSRLRDRYDWCYFSAQELEHAD